jgi:hypothetical protein
MSTAREEVLRRVRDALGTPPGDEAQPAPWSPQVR